jgi:phenylalanyl-tRNA synthetase beta chain
MNILRRLFQKPIAAAQAPRVNAEEPELNHPADNKIIAARVEKVEKHPNADRLHVITLTDGIQTFGPIVCGAFNFSEGDIVALALPGAKIAHNIHSEQHEPFTLGKATIRGVKSQGMICAAFELGLSDDPGDKPEIMVLPPTTALGTMIS